ncbi:hypothetical protein TSMEX_005942, partial [Taenia solium]
DGGEKHEEPSRNHIPLIPMELALRICKYLNATVLVNLCEAVPRWKWILHTSPFSRVVHNGIEEWKWLDNHLCQLLFDEDANITCTNAALATAYRTQQDATFHRLSHANFTEHTRRPVHCLFLPSTSHASRLRDYVREYQCDMQVMNCAPPTRVYFHVASDATRFHHHWYRLAPTSVRTCLPRFSEVQASEIEVVERRYLTDYDCVIVDADYGNAYQLYSSDIKDLLCSMTRSQTLITTGILLYIKGLVTNFDCMQEMFWNLGGFQSSPLSQLSANWRIWCNQHQNDFAIDLVEMVRWACLDVFARRSGEALHC